MKSKLLAALLLVSIHAAAQGVILADYGIPRATMKSLNSLGKLKGLVGATICLSAAHLWQLFLHNLRRPSFIMT